MNRDLYLSYGGERLSYRVNIDQNRASRIAIHVAPDGKVVVDAPPDASDLEIQRAVHKRARWVTSQVNEALLRFRNVRPKEYVSGEEILYIGRRYMLKVLPVDGKKSEVKLRGNRLEVVSSSASRDDVPARIWAWYRVKARDYFARRLAALQKVLPWLEHVPPFQLKEMEKRWGSCTTTGEVILNPHLIKAPRECIDYVLVHELAHIRHHDHGPEFWKLVETFDPNWAQRKSKLDDLVEVIVRR